MVSDRCLGRPTAKQREFLRAETRFVAYGGARGGGKSWAVRKKAILLALRYPGIRLLLLRRTLPELRENHILPLLEELRGIAQYSDSRKTGAAARGAGIQKTRAEPANMHKKRTHQFGEFFSCWRYLFSRPVARQVSSAKVCLTSVFGMGTGGPTPQSTPTSQDTP